MSNIDDRASLQIKTAALARGLKQNQLCPGTGISRSAMSRIFSGNRNQISVGEYIKLHQALGNCPAAQLQKLLQQPLATTGKKQAYHAVKYSNNTMLPMLDTNNQPITLALGQHNTEQQAIRHAKKLLAIKHSIKSMLLGSDDQRWMIYTDHDLNQLQNELN